MHIVILYHHNIRISTNKKFHFINDLYDHMMLNPDRIKVEPKVGSLKDTELKLIQYIPLPQKHQRH